MNINLDRWRGSQRSRSHVTTQVLLKMEPITFLIHAATCSGSVEIDIADIPPK